MPGRIINRYGTITIADSVIANIASETAMQSYGIVGLASHDLREDLIELLKQENLGKGVKILTEGNQITIILNIVIEYDVRIGIVSQNIIESVKFRVEQATGLHVREVIVLVQDIRI
ncbi:MAG: Asp23/Gls24 family envelope stress response protein [Tissierellia bacterium]|jgi:uncharacterized alkaline shock family protein YloU|nr:Asp23/Gls24 family envelope stress response protein [Bacillota bacterium]NLK57855.1 Asp23/Gls24 family envelope stress response protein [Tissierellia bacterium]